MQTYFEQGSQSADSQRIHTLDALPVRYRIDIVSLLEVARNFHIWANGDVFAEDADADEDDKCVRPASQKTIDSLAAVSGSTEMECSVCQCTGSGEFVGTACGHTFHRQCLSTWLRVRGSCPNCRSAVDELEPSA